MTLLNEGRDPYTDINSGVQRLVSDKQRLMMFVSSLPFMEHNGLFGWRGDGRGVEGSRVV